jgi:hypothetical protein
MLKGGENCQCERIVDSVNAREFTCAGFYGRHISAEQVNLIAAFDFLILCCELTLCLEISLFSVVSACIFQGTGRSLVNVFFNERYLLDMI